MGKRRKARECALQLLYELEFDSPELEQTLISYWKHKKVPPEIKEYSEWLVKGILERQKEIDEAIQSVSEHWRLSRMAIVDRNIIRIAVFELLYEESVAPAIIINEAIEIAKRYSGQEAAIFVNGILDALRKKKEKSTKSPEEVKDVRKKRKAKPRKNDSRPRGQKKRPGNRP